MLELKKTVLSKVSFDVGLFEKELAKALKWLVPAEVLELKLWAYANFNGEHRRVLDKYFARPTVKAA